MLKVICNFIPMDIDINISRCEYGKYDIDITCDNNVYVYLAKVKDIKRCTECMPESDKENFEETKRTIQSSSALRVRALRTGSLQRCALCRKQYL